MTETNHSKFKDGLGIGLLVVGIIILLSLVSYSPEDTAVNSVGGEELNNWISIAGAFVADLSRMGLGKIAYLFPVFLLAGALMSFTGRLPALNFYKIAGFIVIFASLCALVALITPQSATSEELIQAGGIVGWLITSKIKGIFGIAGTAIILTGVILIGLVLAVDFSFAKATVWSGAAARKALEWLHFLGLAMRGRVKDAAAARKAAKAAREAAKAEEPQPNIHDNSPHVEQEAKVVKLNFEYPEDMKREEPAQEILEDNDDIDEAVEKPAVAPTSGKKGKNSEPTIRTRADAKKASAQIEFTGFTGSYQPPPIDLLQDYRGKNVAVDHDSLKASCQILEKKLADFNVQGRVTDVHPGPIVTMFEYEPAAGIKVNKIANLEDDLAMVLRAESIRIIAPIPGKGAVGIEVPNKAREVIYLRELLESAPFQKADDPLAVAFGKSITGEPVIQNLAKMPHLLIAGTTGAGKSVFINSIITSILYKSSPENVRLILIDPKMLELSDYAEIPHLLYPVCTQPKKAAMLLRWAVEEMEDRYAKMRDMGVRNVDSYNKKIEKRQQQSGGLFKTDDDQDHLKKLPYIVVIIDELADLMMIAPKQLEESIARLAQMARAAGIHLILATQRPSVDVITGVIKNNLPARVSFRVSSRIDSRTILDTLGAHTLLGKGDMLFLPPTSSRIRRIHGCWISEEEVQDVVQYLKKYGKPNYDQNVIKAIDEALQSGSDDNFDDGEVDPVFDQAVEIVARERKASVSYIQRRLKIGYNRAARIVEQMEREGMVGPADGTSRPREILLPEHMPGEED